MKIKIAIAALMFASSAVAQDDGYVLDGLHDMSQEEFDCLVLNSYFEARNQSSNGQMGVTHVVLNRMADKRYPNTACGVTTQAKYHLNGSIRRNKCQFSWFCDGLSDRPRNFDAYLHSVIVTTQALDLYDYGFDLTDGSTHYHAKSVQPYWSKTIDYITSIDDHHFYRWGAG